MPEPTLSQKDTGFLSLYATALPVRDVLTRPDERAEKVAQAVIAISGIEMAIA
jgi:hypothetical protein